MDDKKPTPILLAMKLDEKKPEEKSPRQDGDIKIMSKTVPNQPPRPHFLNTGGENRFKSGTNNNNSSNTLNNMAGVLAKQAVRQKGQNGPLNHSVSNKTKWRRSKSDGDLRAGLSAITVNEELRRELLPWLESYGLDKYIDMMCHEKIDFEIIPSMVEKDLRNIGINNPQDIKKFLQAIEDLKTVK